MWEGYLTAIEDDIAAHDDVVAHLVIDRFHVAQHYRADFDRLRKQALKRLKKALPKETYDQDGQGTLWLLPKNHADLDDDERTHLRRWLAHSPRLQQAYPFREALTAIFNQAPSRQAGERRLSGWIKKVQLRGLVCFDGFIKTLSSHWQPILNYFVDRLTSGFVEGLNNKIKTVKRRFYGIKKVSTLFQRLWLDWQGRYQFFSSTP
jgi:transposase